MHPSSSNGFSTTLLLLVPLLAVPFVAAVGLPQVSSKPAAAGLDQPDVGPVTRGERSTGAEHGVAGTERSGAPAYDTDLPGRSSRRPGQPADADDLFAPFESAAWPRRETAYDEPASADARDPDRRSRIRALVEAGGLEDRLDASDDVPVRPGPEPRVERAGRERDLAAAAASDRPVVRPDAFADAFADGFADDLLEDPRGARPQRTLAAEFREEQPFASDRDAPPFGREPSPPSDRTPAARSGALTWDSAVRRLKQLGVADFNLSPGGGESAFHFSCHLAAPGAPDVLHRFEAEAAEPLAAVQDVLAQLERWLDESTAGVSSSIEDGLARLNAQ